MSITLAGWPSAAARLIKGYAFAEHDHPVAVRICFLKILQQTVLSVPPRVRTISFFLQATRFISISKWPLLATIAGRPFISSQMIAVDGT